MRGELSELEGLVANDQLERAIERAARTLALHRDHKNELVALEARLGRLRKRHRRGLITAEKADVEGNRLAAAFLSLLGEIGEQKEHERTEQDHDLDSEKPTVFLSYSSQDRAQMLKLQEALRERGLDVETDLEDFEVGGSLEESIGRALRQTTATFCLISERSLLSDWVAFEILRSLGIEDVTRRRRFFAGYLDERFLEPGFRLEATDEIDRQLAELDRLADEQRRRRLDLRDLDRRRDRLIRLRNGLGTVLGRLRESLALDLREPAFENSVERFCSAVHALARPK